VDAVLSISTNDLVLARNGTFAPQNGTTPAVASKARTLTITNTSNFMASNVTYTISPALPTGTTISPSSCGNINHLGTCTLTITPGFIPSTAAPNLPTPSVITVSGVNTNKQQANITILTYANNYQGGYVYSMDDSPLPGNSIEGKVSSVTPVSTSSASSFPWDSLQSCIINGICPSVPGTSLTDGQNNTTLITTALETQGALPNTFAASVCASSSSGGHTDWYLPAICEMSFMAAGQVFGYQGSTTIPLIQNMVNIYNAYPSYSYGAVGSEYWSSFQPAETPAFFVSLISAGNFSIQGYAAEYKPMTIFCSRKF
jgi:hypothetical protein